MDLYNKLIEKLKSLKVINSDEDESFAEFMIFFDQEFNKLDIREQNSFLLMIQRDNKLKKLL